MKKLLAIALVTLFAANVFGQASPTYSKGQISVGGGIGLAATLGGTPLWVGGEYGFNEEWGIGANAAMSSYEYTAGLWDLTFYQIGVYGIYHKDVLKMDNLDTYGKVGIAMLIASWDYTGPSNLKSFYSEPSVSGFGYDAAVGATYYVMPKLGVNAELGYGLALIKVGVNYKL